MFFRYKLGLGAIQFLMFHQNLLLQFKPNVMIKQVHSAFVSVELQDMQLPLIECCAALTCGILLSW